MIRRGEFSHIIIHDKGVVVMVRAGWATLAFLVFICSPLPGAWAESPSMVVEDAVICREVNDLNPEGISNVFPYDTHQVYCFTRIVNAQPPTSIIHVWYYGNREMARITLPVSYSTWRTYSTITIYEEWTGRWSVAVLSPENNILKVLTFTIETKGRP